MNFFTYGTTIPPHPPSYPQYGIDPRLNDATNQAPPQQTSGAGEASTRTWIDPATPNILRSNENFTRLLSHSFWGIQTTRILDSGEVVQGTHIQLLQHEELRYQLLDAFFEADAAEQEDEFAVQNGRHEQLLQTDLSSHGTDSANTLSASNPYYENPDRAPPPTPSETGLNEDTAASQLLLNVVSAALENSTESDDGETERLPTHSAPSPHSANHATAPQAMTGMSIPAYVADISSAQAAREIVAHPDVADCKKLDIQNDDVATVKTAQHEHAKMLYDALLAPGYTSADINAKHRNPDFEPRMKAKFDAQQASGKAEIRLKMQTAGQAQRVRANCFLAVDAAIFLHEHGVPKNVLKAANGKSEERRTASVDAKSTCSERLTKMAAAIQNHKLVAQDVAEGNNLHELAWDPEACVVRKITYAKSNLARQFTQDKKKATQAAGGAGAKRKRATAAYEDEDEELEGEGRTKRKR